jgi:hypothetical protein
MKEFEILSNGGGMVDHVQLSPNFEAAVSELFDGRVFDMDTPATVVPLIDEAKQRLHSDPEKYRPMLTSADGMGLRKVRHTLDSIRQLLVIFPDATISGPMEPDVPATP